MKKLLSMALSMMLLCNIIMPTGVAFGESNTENINFISKSLDNMIYTYEEDGTTFKVIEKLTEKSNEKGEIYSEIYKMENGEYKLYKTATYELDKTTNDYNYIVEDYNGKVLYESIGNVEDDFKISDMNEKNSSNYAVENPGGSAGWSYKYSVRGDGSIEGLTVSVVSYNLGNLIAKISGKIPSSVAKGASFVLAAATHIVSSKIPKVYMTIDYYVRYENGLISSQQWATNIRKSSFTGSSLSKGYTRYDISGKRWRTSNSFI